MCMVIAERGRRKKKCVMRQKCFMYQEVERNVVINRYGYIETGPKIYSK